MKDGVPGPGLQRRLEGWREASRTGRSSTGLKGTWRSPGGEAADTASCSCRVPGSPWVSGQPFQTPASPHLTSTPLPAAPILILDKGLP